MNTINQKPPTLLTEREVLVKSIIYPQVGSHKWAMWRRRREAHEAFDKLLFAEEVFVDLHDLNATSHLHTYAMFDRQLREFKTIDQGDVLGNTLGSIRTKAARRSKQVTLNSS